jgi:hypothetical protein
MEAHRRMVPSLLQTAMLGLIVLAYYGQAEASPAPAGRPVAAVDDRSRSDRSAGARAPTSSASADSAPFPAGPSSSSNQLGGSEAEIGNIEAMHRAIMVNQPIARWRFETVRSRYLALLKRAGDNRALEEAIRVRLAQVTRHEQAAAAARSMQSILAESHRRDHEVATLKRRIAAAARSRARAYSAVGFMQSSAKGFDGRKLYVLIANDGLTIAYLDIPPGLDPSPLVAQRVGVRGVPHFNEDLGARLISVRDIEAIESRR